MVVVWFLAICSIVVHGLSIPLGKLGFFLPRTLSRVFTSQGNDEVSGLRISSEPAQNLGVLRERRKKGTGASGQSTPRPGSGSGNPRQIYRVGGSVIPGNVTGTSGTATPVGERVERTIRFPDDEQVASGSVRGD